VEPPANAPNNVLGDVAEFFDALEGRSPPDHDVGFGRRPDATGTSGPGVRECHKARADPAWSVQEDHQN
jgi:hypothetical protein